MYDVIDESHSQKFQIPLSSEHTSLRLFFFERAVGLGFPFAMMARRKHAITFKTKTKHRSKQP